MIKVVYTPAFQVYLSKRCAFACDYCNFPNVPSALPPSPKNFRAHLRTAQRAGAWQVTLTSGEGIDRFAEVESTVRYYGFSNWFDYLYHICLLTLEARGQQPLTPVLDVGPLPTVQLRRLAPVVPLMRLMLDSADSAVHDTVHAQAPQKHTLLRSLALNDVGRAGIPLATGMRIGLGESRDSWEEAVDVVNEVHRRHGNVMSFHLVPFVPQPFSKMKNHLPVSTEVFQDAIKQARKYLDPDINLVAEVHERLGLAAECIVSGAFDLGSIKIADNDRFDPDILNSVSAVKVLLSKISVSVDCSPVLRDNFIEHHRLPAAVEQNLSRFAPLVKTPPAAPYETPAEGTSIPVG